MSDYIVHPLDFIERDHTDPWWDEYNPWREHLVYVPIPKLAECVLGIGQDIDTGARIPVVYTPDLVLRIWRQNGSRLDGYILIGNILTAGVRYGPDPADYLSPGFSTPKLVTLLRETIAELKKRKR